METSKAKSGANQPPLKGDWIETVIILVTSVLAVVVFILALVKFQTPRPLVEGSEKTYSGTVVDSARSDIDNIPWTRDDRAYIGVGFPDGTGACFWEHKNLETDAKIGDRVTVESAIEEGTGLLIAVRVTVYEEGTQ